MSRINKNALTGEGDKGDSGKKDKNDKQVEVVDGVEFIGYKIMKGDPNINDTGYIWGDCVIYDGLAWYCTSLAPVTIYDKKSDFDKAIKKSKKKWPEVKLKVVKAYRLANGEIPTGEFDEVAFKLQRMTNENPFAEESPFIKSQLDKMDDDVWQNETGSDDDIPF